MPDPPEWPPIYFGGSSPPALKVAARHADVYLTWGEPPEQVAEKLDRVRELADAEGRELGYGIRLHTIARETSEEAWAAADKLLSNLSRRTDIERAQANLRASSSEGQRRMLDLHGGSTDGLEIYPNLWAGVGLVRGGAGTALVGSYEEVADRIAEYHELGLGRVHPVRLSPPRGGLPRRRGRPARSCASGAAEGGGAARPGVILGGWSAPS